MQVKSYQTIIYPDGTSQTIESVEEMLVSEYLVSRCELVKYLSIKYGKDFSLRLSIADTEIPLSKIYYTLQRLDALGVLTDTVVVGETDQVDNVLYISVPNANLRVVLTNLNMFTTVNDAIQQSSDTNLKQYWEYANYIDYDNPYIQQMGAQLNISPSTLEQLFLTAVVL